MKSSLRSLFLAATVGFLTGLSHAADEPLEDAKPPPSQNTEQADAAADTKNEPKGSKMTHHEDGSFDVSKVADKSRNVIPLVFPITEPAVGYGALGGLIFLEQPEETKEGETMRPNIMAFGGLATENGTWGAFGGDLRHWMDNQIETIFAGGYASVNLTYYPPGSGGPNTEDSQPLEYNIKAPFVSLRGIYRFEKSPWSVSLGYVLAGVKVSVPGDRLPPEVILPPITQTQAALAPAVTYDTRNNVFTPTHGLYVTAAASLFSGVWGSSSDYQLPYVTGMFYHPIADKVFFGLKADLKAAYGDVPFYARPFIMLRGIPALRYQGDRVGQFETELRWQCYKRFSLVGFGGYGTAWSDFRNTTRSESATTYGVGFRYEIARDYGLHMGVDIARGPEDTVLYVQFGSAWLAP